MVQRHVVVLGRMVAAVRGVGQMGVGIGREVVADVQHQGLLSFVGSEVGIGHRSIHRWSLVATYPGFEMEERSRGCHHVETGKYLGDRLEESQPVRVQGQVGSNKGEERGRGGGGHDVGRGLARWWVDGKN